MPLVDKAATIGGFVVAGPPGAIAARRGVAAGRVGFHIAKKANAAKKGFAEAKKEKEKHNSPSAKCQGDFQRLYGQIAAREAFLNAKHTLKLSSSEVSQKKREWDAKINKTYDELMACECGQNRCRRK